MKNPLEHLEAAARLERMGITIRSAELREEAARIKAFYERGNRRMRRANATADTSHEIAPEEKRRRRAAAKAARRSRKRNRS